MHVPLPTTLVMSTHTMLCNLSRHVPLLVPLLFYWFDRSCASNMPSWERVCCLLVACKDFLTFVKQMIQLFLTNIKLMYCMSWICFLLSRTIMRNSVFTMNLNRSYDLLFPTGSTCLVQKLCWSRILEQGRWPLLHLFDGN